MKKFKFRLENLLRLRRQEEDQKKQVVGILMSKIQEQQQQALEMAAAIQQEGQKLKQHYTEGTVDLDWVGHYRVYVMHLQQAINERIKKVAEIQEKLKVAREELVKAAQQTKILEKLRERQKERYDRASQRIETVQQDEISSSVFVREILSGKQNREVAI